MLERSQNERILGEYFVFEKKQLRNLSYDEEKIDALIRENYMYIYRYCFFYVGNKEVAQDITQDVFLKFVKELEHYREYGKLKNYLYVIAKNSIKDYFRKPKETDLEDVAEVCYDGGLAEAPVRLDILNALESLETLDKELIILRYYQELRIKDIVQFVNMPASTVRYKLKNAEKVLKARLGVMKYDR